MLLKSAKAPTASLKTPLSLQRRALVPTATFSKPAVLSNIAPVPTAVLESAPVVVRASVPAPTPVLKLASPAKKSEYQPIPEFPIPAPSRARALHPSAVVNAGEHPV